MSRYFAEVCYRGTHYAGFQIQQNAVTIQSELERAMAVVMRRELRLTGSSRTDSGVHARQNYFHFDWEGTLAGGIEYNLNAVLPPDIAVRSLRKVAPDGHCRYDALARRYRYTVYSRKNPFLSDRGYYFPYRIDLGRMREAAALVREHSDFRSFSKRRSQVKTFICAIAESDWMQWDDCLIYEVKANRFLRGMVRGLVGTMLQVGRGKIDMDTFDRIIRNGNPAAVDFSVPGAGLCLEEVVFEAGYFG